jgi:hypothetical protein
MPDSNTGADQGPCPDYGIIESSPRPLLDSVLAPVQRLRIMAGTWRALYVQLSRLLRPRDPAEWHGDGNRVALVPVRANRYGACPRRSP